MTNIYEMLIRFNPDGTFKGAHQKTRDSVTGKEAIIPINPADWEAVVPQLNANLVQALDNQDKQMDAQNKQMQELLKRTPTAKQ